MSQSPGCDVIWCANVSGAHTVLAYDSNTVGSANIQNAQMLLINQTATRGHRSFSPGRCGAACSAPPGRGVTACSASPGHCVAACSAPCCTPARRRSPAVCCGRTDCQFPCIVTSRQRAPVTHDNSINSCRYDFRSFRQLRNNVNATVLASCHLIGARWYVQRNAVCYCGGGTGQPGPDVNARYANRVCYAAGDHKA